ncbi:hypothetical protein M404DRAFT_758360 [Pisolithus tinctorius Marx 270]|uniref:Uncharacterized protein n=1 Tax=Pisolithus tinctorius Marx 270 TaxID=870435 RepID=A0A0C3NZH9_PISTI|nr:hypothetical protein M404DRAFT_758360 [Pisolithus tinctorius Marx 270]
MYITSKTRSRSRSLCDRERRPMLMSLLPRWASAQTVHLGKLHQVLMSIVEDHNVDTPQTAVTTVCH